MFHIRLKLLRELMNLTQTEMATMLDMAPNAYQRYELGTRQPKFDILIKLANYFCVSTDYLLGHSDDPQHEKHV
jgi:transcriptional regulator with XRE-family HTH domain